jgi:hypothetical protein
MSECIHGLPQFLCRLCPPAPQSGYLAFLEGKATKAAACGIDRVPQLAGHLFDFQRSVAEFCLRAGRSGCFLDTGLGKTEIQLEFCQKAIEATNGAAILWTPLAVAGQTKRRAERWGYAAKVIRDQSEAERGISNICNYDRRDKIDPSFFPVISCDEASIFKSFTGATTREMSAAHRGARFKLVATATPAPNDHMEIGNYADFLEIMAGNEMLSRFFINDTSTASQEWRLKGHAEHAFWDWMASWARMAEKPSDITGRSEDDAGYNLPPFEIIRHAAHDDSASRDFAEMFGAAVSATNMHEIKRQTIEARAGAIADAVAAEPDEPWLIWCDTNYEADVLKSAIADVIEVRGSQSIDEKEELLEAFGTGQAKRLIAKPSMCGYGLDWSHVARMAFVGRSYSYETWYQAVRRAWRFGQTRALKVHLAVSEGESEIGRVIDRKAADHGKMKSAMRDAMVRATGREAQRRVAYNPQHLTETPEWLRSAA